jgi:uncharacterized membrane protein YdjX (TVP38/TMEM64 family)
VSRPAVRLIGATVTLAVIGLLVFLSAPVTREGLRGAIEPFGPLAPAVFVVVSALLALGFVPGPLLSAASGALFGLWLGFACTLLSASLTGVLAVLIGSRVARDDVIKVSSPRTLALADLARRRGTSVVVLQRLIPAVPDAPFSYLFGALGLSPVQVALGTAIGSAPRAFSYTALGRAATTGDRRLAVIAVVVAALVSLVGAVAGVVVVRRHNAAQTDSVDPVDPVDPVDH